MKIILFYILFLTNLFAKDNQKIQKIKVEANEIKVARRKNNISFTGKVIVREGKMQFKADKMNVKYTNKNAKDFDIYHIVAESNVKVITDAITASGERGDYDLNSHIIKLENNVVLNDNISTVYGSKLIYNTNNETVEIFGDDNADKEKEQVYIILEDSNKIKENYGEKK